MVNPSAGVRFNVSSDTVNLGAFTVARGNNNQNGWNGEVLFSGGTVVVTNDFVIGFAGLNNLGKVILSGATVNVGPLATKWLMVGRWDTTSGQLNINSGALNLMANTAIKMNADGTIAPNVVNQNGGTVTFYSDAGTTVGGTGDLDLQRVGAAASVNTYNLNGGTLTVPRISSTATTGSRTFNFNGGTLKAAAASTTFLNLVANGPSRINVRNGGAIIDSNGKDITIVQSLDHSDVGGDAAVDGGLTKSGAGTLTLAGGSSYTGPTIVTGGGLSVSPASFSYAATTLAVSNTALSIDVSGGSTSLSPTSVTLQNNTVLNFNYGAVIANPTAPALNVSGSLTAPGTGLVINITGFGLKPGTFTLIDYTGTALANLANFSLGPLPPGVVATLVNNTINTSIDLNITASGQNLTWVGTNANTGLIDNTWDIAITTNWVENGGSTSLRYQEYTTTATVGDPVLFDDSVFNDFINPQPTNINLTAALSPFTVTVSSTLPYRFSGTLAFVLAWSAISAACAPLTIPTKAAALAADGGYLFVTFTGEQSPLTEQIYFAMRQAGRQWNALNGAEPVLISKLGEQGVRDPYLLRSHAGKKFYRLATDLSVHLNHGWDRAQTAGSQSIVIWESSDLVPWLPPRLVRVAAPDAGCTWAPEAVYDESTGDYFVFWASKNGSDNFAKQRIWAARTQDFQTFTAPFIYIDKPGHVIDTDIVRAGDKYYRFAKDETFKAVTLEVSDKLMGPGQDVPQFSLAKLQGYEGPGCYQLKRAAGGKPATWCLVLDHYSKSAGYQPFVTDDLSGGQFTHGGPSLGLRQDVVVSPGQCLKVAHDFGGRLDSKAHEQISREQARPDSHRPGHPRHGLPPTGGGGAVPR